MDFFRDLSKLASLVFDDKINIIFEGKLQKKHLKIIKDAGLCPSYGHLYELFYEDKDVNIEDYFEDEQSRKEESEIEKLPNTTIYDVLGSYFPQIKTIIIYQACCRIVATKLNRSQDTICKIVLAHEQAHAVTHLGRDNINEIWRNFTIASVYDKELFAQIYPYRMFKNRISETVYSDLYDAFVALSNHQDSRYNEWRQFENSDINTVNYNLLMARRKKYPNDMPDDIQKNVDKIKKDDGSYWPPRQEDGNYPVGRSGAGIINKYFPENGSYNCIPSNKKGSCKNKLVVAIGSEDDVEKRLLEALEQAYAHCPGITNFVLVVAFKWDVLAWSKHKHSFKGLEVWLFIPRITLELLISMKNKHAYPWNERAENSRIVKDLNARINDEFPIYNFKTYQGNKMLGAISYSETKEYNITPIFKYKVECSIVRHSVTIRALFIKGNKEEFYDWANDIWFGLDFIWNEEKTILYKETEQIDYESFEEVTFYLFRDFISRIP